MNIRQNFSEEERNNQVNLVLCYNLVDHLAISYIKKIFIRQNIGETFTFMYYLFSKTQLDINLVKKNLITNC